MLFVFTKLEDVSNDTDSVELDFEVQYFSPVFENDTISGITAHFALQYPSYSPSVLESVINDVNEDGKR